MRNVLILFAVLGMLLVSGCTSLDSISGPGAGSGSYSNSGMMRTQTLPPRASGEFAAAPAPMPSSSSGDVAKSPQVIKTANAEVEVPSGTVKERYAKFKAMITGEGGQISSADYREGDNTKEYNVVAKIPPSKFEELAPQLQSIGTVKQMSSNAEDVSEQYVDIQTRIKNLQIQRDDIRKLFERNGSLEDVLAVENELNRVQTEIELYQNQQLNMDRQVAMSSVTVRIFEQAPAVATNIFEPLSGVGNLFLGALSVAILVLAAVLGFGIPVFVAGFVLYKLYRHFRPKNGSKAGKK